MNKNKIFVACDSTNVSKIRKIIKETKSSKLKLGYKFGLEFLNSKNGRDFISKLKNKTIFADLKLLAEWWNFERNFPQSSFRIVQIHVHVFIFNL